MRPDILVVGLVSPEEVSLLEEIRRLVDALPDIKLSDGGEENPVSCHLLARAIAPHFPVTVKDGSFGSGGWAHSWFTTHQGNIIDVYPWAQVGGPTLLSMARPSPWRDLFIERDVAIDTPQFCKDLEIVNEVVEKTLKKLRPWSC